MPPPSEAPPERTERRTARTSVSEAREQQPPSGSADRKRKQPADSGNLQSTGVETPMHKRRMIESTPKSTTSSKPRPSGSPVATTSVASTSKTPSSTNANTKSTKHEEPLSEPISLKDGDATVDSFLLELPFLPSSPEPESGDVDTWVDDCLRTGKAPLDTIVDALRCTTMDPRLADKVLGHLRAGKGIPDDIPGVWTHEDDKCLEAKDGRMIDKLIKKHGNKNFDDRWAYLRQAREQGFEKHTDD